MNILMGCKTDFGKLRRLVSPYPLAEDFEMYNLRHTFATDLRDAGVDIIVAMPAPEMPHWLEGLPSLFGNVRFTSER
jgi:hypothetical protein